MLLPLLMLSVAALSLGHDGPVMRQCLPPPAASTPADCPTYHTSSLKFFLTSRRNETGHWVAQARTERGCEQGPAGSHQNETGLWDVHLEQISIECTPGHYIEVVATITGTATCPIVQPEAKPERLRCAGAEPEPPTTDTILRPAPGYKLFPGVGHYKIHEVPKTWDQARKTCNREGGHLVIINSEEESAVLQRLFASVSKINGANHNDYAFLGFHDRFVEGEFLTIFGKPLDSTGYEPWSTPGQPDNAGGSENCGSINRNGNMNDINCHWKLAFFCEQELC